MKWNACIRIGHWAHNHKPCAAVKRLMANDQPSLKDFDINSYNMTMPIVAGTAPMLTTWLVGLPGVFFI